MSRSRMAFLICCLLLARTSLAMGVDAGPLERHLRTLRSVIQRQYASSHVTRFADGKMRERFTVNNAGYTLEQYDTQGAKVLQWSRKKNGQIGYEAWYGPRLTKERMLEDDRTLSYTSFYRSGQKWEQYMFNKSKRIKAYYVYNRDGKLVP